MTDSRKRVGALLRSTIILAALNLPAGSGPVRAETGAKPLTPEEQAMEERVKKAVIEELQRGALNNEINKGISAYLDKQRTDRQAALEAARTRAAELAKTVQPVSAGRDHILGNPEATVSLIEYADFECPYCKRFHSTATQVVTSYGDKVNWVYRHLPLSFHNPDAEKLAEASECIAEQGGNEAFWKFTDRVFGQAEPGKEGVPLDKLGLLAGEMNLDGAVFEQCLDSGRTGARVREDATEAVRVGVMGTPGNILLNRKTGEAKVVSGNVPEKTLRAAIDELLTSATN
jgi:protein-disulfide isomerase